jgi:hypothetical protein
MHDQRKAVDIATQDLRDEQAVLMHVVETHPDTLRLSDLNRELGDPEGSADRDRIERAVRDLIRVGLLFRCEGVVLPTRQTIRAYELFNA